VGIQPAVGSWYLILVRERESGGRGWKSTGFFGLFGGLPRPGWHAEIRLRVDLLRLERAAARAGVARVVAALVFGFWGSLGQASVRRAGGLTWVRLLCFDFFYAGGGSPDRLQRSNECWDLICRVPVWEFVGLRGAAAESSRSV
jgi:hypothetical protein